MTQFEDWLALVADKFRWSTSESSLDVCSLRQVNEKPFEDVKHCMSSLTKGNCSCCMFLLLVPIISPLYSTVNFWDWENGGEPDICKVGAINMFLWAVDKRGFQHVSGLNLPLSEQYHSFTIASQKSTLVLKGTGTGLTISPTPLPCRYQVWWSSHKSWVSSLVLVSMMPKGPKRVKLMLSSWVGRQGAVGAMFVG